MDGNIRQEGSADVRQLVRRAAALRRRYIRRVAGRILRRLTVAMACRRAESELGALSDRALHDLGVDRGGIMYAVRYGRRERRAGALRRLLISARRLGTLIWNRRTRDHESASRQIRQGMDRSLEQP
ncbi:MAG: DUF1127 domain-containing protein [Thiobacillus sp.]|nr:MAG: DUF1127 domain-containing protein [Thiobacillus sp.]